MKRGAASGFSAMEALVALAILAIALLPVLELESQTNRSIERMAAERSALASQRNALAMLDTINPMLTPRGERPLGGGELMLWRASALAPSRTALARQGATQGFEVALYRLHIEVRDRRNRLRAAFAVDQIGWRATSSAQP